MLGAEHCPEPRFTLTATRSLASAMQVRANDHGLFHTIRRPARKEPLARRPRLRVQGRDTGRRRTRCRRSRTASVRWLAYSIRCTPTLALAFDRLAGARRCRQGWHHPAGLHRHESTGLPVSRPSRSPRRRSSTTTFCGACMRGFRPGRGRDLQPLALRGCPGGARSPPGAAREMGELDELIKASSAYNDVSITEHYPEVLPLHLEGGAVGALRRPSREPAQALEGQRERFHRAELLGRA